MDDFYAITARWMCMKGHNKFRYSVTNDKANRHVI